MQRQVNRLPRDHERFRLARDFILHALVTLQIIIETVQPRKEKFIYFSQIGVREKKNRKKSTKRCRTRPPARVRQLAE